MNSCPKCTGFMPESLSSCPNCEHSVPGRRRTIKKVGALLGGAAVSMTLMACYGAPSLEEMRFRREPPADCDPEKDPECPKEVLAPIEAQ